MSFEHPTAGLLALAIGLPLLLLFYMLKLRRLPLRISSTRLWTRSTSDTHANVPLRWLRRSWLLFLHLVILALICGAIARPILGDGSPGGRTIIVIDASASMNARDGRPIDGVSTTRFEEARREASALVERGSLGDSMVIRFANNATQQTPLTSSERILIEAIEAIDPTDQPRHEGRLLDLITSLAADIDDEEDPLQIVLFTDRLVDRAPFDALNARLLIRAVGGRRPDGANIGFVEGEVRRDPDDPERVLIFARLASTMTTEREVIVAVHLDGTLVQTEAVTLGPASGADMSTADLRLTLDRPESGVLTISHAVDDLLSADDVFGVVLAPPDEPTIDVVTPAGVAASPFLRSAVDSIGGDRVRTWDITAFRAANAGDVVVFDGVDAPMSDRNTFVLNASSPSLGITLGDPVAGASEAERWERSHPTMAYVGLDTLYVEDARPVEVDGSTPWSVNPIVTGTSGPLVVAIGRPGDVRARHLVTTFDLQASNWPVDASFVVFIANAIDWLSCRALDLRGVSYGPNEPVTVQADGSRSDVVLRDDAGSLIARHAVRVDGSANLGVLERVGRVRCEGTIEKDRDVFVNLLDIQESSIRVAARSEGDTGVTGRLGRRELWVWFIGIAGLLLTIEWFIYGWQSRV